MSGITLTGSLLGSFVNGGAAFNTTVSVGLAGALGTNASTAWQMSRNVGAGGNADPIYTGGSQAFAAHSVIGMVQAATATSIPLYLRFVVPVGVALVSFVAYFTRAKEAKPGEEAEVNKFEPIYKGAMFLRDHMCLIMKVVAVAAAVLMILGGNLPMGITLLLSLSMNLLIESGYLQKYLSPETYNRILWMEKFLSSVFCIFGGPLEFVIGVINLVSCAGEFFLFSGDKTKENALLEYTNNATRGGLLVRNPELLLEEDPFHKVAFDSQNKTQLNPTIQFNSNYVHFLHKLLHFASLIP